MFTFISWNKHFKKKSIARSLILIMLFSMISAGGMTFAADYGTVSGTANVTLEEVGTISGTVSDTLGEPARRISIHVLDGVTHEWVGHVWTADDGTFTINVPTGTYRFLIQSPPEGPYLAAVFFMGINVVANTTTTQNITLETGGRVSGRITDPNGVGIDDVGVRLNGWGTSTNNEGYFTTIALLPGTYQAKIFLPEGVNTSADLIYELTISAGTTIIFNVSLKSLAAAEAAVEKAEDAPLSTQAEVDTANELYEEALVMVEALPEGTVKEGLTDRLDLVRTAIDDAQEAIDETQKVIVPVTDVTVTPETSTIKVGSSIQLTAAVAPSNATNQEVIWSSSDENVAIVSQTGLVTAVGIGTAKITATTVDGQIVDTSDITAVFTILSIDLRKGWNLISTPIILDERRDSLREILYGLDWKFIYSFCGETQKWIFIDEESILNPLDAMFVYMQEAGQVMLMPYEGLSSPPSKSLYGGWNLVSLASLTSMRADRALISVYDVRKPGQAVKVISPLFNSEQWDFTRIDTVIPNMHPFEGYWLFMDGEDILAGFTTTPLN